MELIVSPISVARAWRQVRRNRGAPGPDGLTITECEGWCEAHWPAVRQQLLDGTYRPAPVRCRPPNSLLKNGCREGEAPAEPRETSDFPHAHGFFNRLLSGGARIPKDGGGERQLGISNVLDRLIQQAISQVLTLIFDPGFSDSSRPIRPRSRETVEG